MTHTPLELAAALRRTATWCTNPDSNRCSGIYDDGNGGHCAVGWLNADLHTDHSATRHDAVAFARSHTNILVDCWEAAGINGGQARERYSFMSLFDAGLYWEVAWRMHELADLIELAELERTTPITSDPTPVLEPA